MEFMYPVFYSQMRVTVGDVFRELINSVMVMNENVLIQLGLRCVNAVSVWRNVGMTCFVASKKRAYPPENSHML